MRNAMTTISNEELQLWIEQVSLGSFGVPFRHKASFNNRLTTTGGRYFTKSHNIEINPQQLAMYGREETEKIIKHELCHYHLHLAKRGYMHRDADFKSLLAQVGGSRYCGALPGPRPVSRSLTGISSCAPTVPWNIRASARLTKRYRCGKCAGKLKLVALELGNGQST